ncbi:pilus assembly PilX family protein [Pseudoalteromonas sp. SSDWG2]|uniref:pilus assembly PilX family protein n=1 Tax=Pseudoalteromonas sp. SSDWG2 TaxID=3139391 RepID=UPI003BAD4B34
MVYRTLNIHKQQGVVLVAAIVMVLVVSGIAVTLMSNSSVDMKVINAAQDYDQALSQAHADTSRAIYTELKSSNGINFTTPNLGTVDESVPLVAEGAEAALTLVKAPGVLSATNCSRKRAANDTSADIKCSRDLRVNSTVFFGKGNRHSVSVVSGIEQESL